MVVEATAQVTYTCYLTEEDEKRVQEYAKEKHISLDEAVKQLWEDNQIDIYAGDYHDSDCSTEDVQLIEN